MGKNAQGNIKHIKINKKDDNEGIGFKENVINDIGDSWWYDLYNSTVGNNKNKNITDEELFKKTGGVRLGMRARAPQV